MTDVRHDLPVCPVHGKPTKRDTCAQCNAAYMRDYQRRVRKTRPARALLERARQRAHRQGIPYSLRREDISVPRRCPVLGLSLVVGGSRSDASPSLDRIEPGKGYTAGNVRVISDRANRLKSDQTLDEVRLMSRKGPPGRRAEYAALAAYMEREALLIEVKRKALMQGNDSPWSRIAEFLEEKFRHYPAPIAPENQNT